MGDNRADDARRGPAGHERPVIEDAGPIHVHALSINPDDGALFIATHTGLFRASRPGTKPKRVAGRWQDTMGFTVIGADHFLASGHPDGREQLPPFLGLIESRDAGQTWKEISLQGTMDFHVLEAAQDRIYGFGTEWETRGDRLLVSNDGGETWWRRRAPEPLVDLAISPRDPDTAIASGGRRLYVTRDAAQRWSELSAGPALLTWRGRRLLAVDPRGVVRDAAPNLGRWRVRGRTGGQPAALAAGPGGQLYVALHDGTIKQSTDGGVTWSPWTASRDPGEKQAGAGDPSAGADEPQAPRAVPDERPNRSHEALPDVFGETEAE